MNFDKLKDIADRNGLVRVSVRCASGRHQHCETSSLEKPVYMSDVNKVALDSFSLYAEPRGYDQFNDLYSLNDAEGDCCGLEAEEWSEESYFDILREAISEAKEIGWTKSDVRKLLDELWNEDDND